MIKVVVPISGGKDSQACLKLALQKFDKSEVIGLFCDTKFEHPITYNHVNNLKKLYGVEIITVCAGDVPSKVIRYGRFPSGTARFCTSELKIIPSKYFYVELAERQGGFEVWYGMRSEESNQRRERYKDVEHTDLYMPHEIMQNYPKKLAKLGVMFRLPILDYTEKEVFELLGNEANPLYKSGFGRVGCFPCLAAGDKHKELAFQFDEVGKKHYETVKILEKQIGKSVWTSKGGSQRNNTAQDEMFSGCAVCAI